MVGTARSGGTGRTGNHGAGKPGFFAYPLAVADAGCTVRFLSNCDRQRQLGHKNAIFAPVAPLLQRWRAKIETFVISKPFTFTYSGPSRHKVAAYCYFR